MFTPVANDIVSLDGYCGFAASAWITASLTLLLPHSTHGKQSPVVGLFSGILEYSGTIPSFPYGLMNSFA